MAIRSSSSASSNPARGARTPPTAALLLLLALPGRAENRAPLPSWFVVDAARKHVRIDLVAGFNANNGALNFNGFYGGDMTIALPPGWTVDVAFRNQDAMLPHSLLVTRAFDPKEMPQLAGVQQVAIPRAYSNDPEQGIPTPGGDSLTFVPVAAGDFDFLCGVAGHAQAGMWTRLKIDAALTAPTVTVAAGAEPGRP
jgi:sulfocyanin